MTNKPPC